MRPQLTIVLLLVACFCLATSVDVKLNSGKTSTDTSVLNQFMGEGRKLFANQFFVRSDVYFHSGYYPSMFDQASTEENHLAQRAGAEEKHGKHETNSVAHEDQHGHDEGHDEEEHDFLGKPKDFMDAFSRHFIVSEHTHLTEKGTNAAREILPWLKLAAQMDPSKVESYTVAAYWLRDLGREAEAEEFLREGLRRNPRSYEILLELGRSHYERQDYERARNIWEMAMQRWREQENSKPADKQNVFVVEQILNSLATVETRLGNRNRAIEWLKIVKKVSPTPAEIDKRIAEVNAGQLLDAPLAK
jgi:tetratricopeptide (TPR) repeat protein